MRVVVVNWNGGEFTLDCVRSLLETDWPAEALEVLLVDNDSTDGSLEKIEKELPAVSVVRNDENCGFAEACNEGMRDLDDYDYVALVNNDATVDPGWLRPLVATLEADPRIGAACPKILFTPVFVDVEVAVRRRPEWDEGVTIRSVRVDGRDVTTKVHFRSGFEWARDRFRVGSGDRRIAASGVMRVPIPTKATSPE